MIETEPNEDGSDWGRRRSLRSIREMISRDDILTGFTVSESHSPEIRTFFVSTIGASIAAWDVAFNLGAFHTVFFGRRALLGVVLFVAVLGAIALRRQVHIHWWLLALLATPMIWILFKLVTPLHDVNSVTGTIDTAFFAVILLLFPVAFWIVLRIVAPEYFAIQNLRLKIASAAIVLAIASLGYTAGEFSPHWLTCDEFKVSGNDFAADCADG